MEKINHNYPIIWHSISRLLIKGAWNTVRNYPLLDVSDLFGIAAAKESIDSELIEEEF